jgi:hypothetical protein
MNTHENVNTYSKYILGHILAHAIETARYSSKVHTKQI